MAIYVKLNMIDVTMKKIYINPTMTIVKIQSQHQLAGSEQLGVNNTEVDAANADARRGHLWDDEDEEYEDY